MNVRQTTSIALASLSLVFGGCSSHIRTARDRTGEQITLGHPVKTVSFLDDKLLYAGGYVEEKGSNLYTENFSILERHGNSLVVVGRLTSRKTKGTHALFMQRKVQRLDKEHVVFLSKAAWSNGGMTNGYRAYVSTFQGNEATPTALTTAINYNAVFIAVPKTGATPAVFLYDAESRYTNKAKIISTTEGIAKAVEISQYDRKFLNDALRRGGPCSIFCGQIENGKLRINRPNKQPYWKPDSELFAPSSGFMANTATTATTIERAGYVMVVGVDGSNAAVLHVATGPLPD
ncbi:MAG: hypothetical protein GYA55_08460 [SAR324 cluster bacterium]|uniref:Lipoprotein n=1 Tax=SAR324 cluster bacterium TaxID=2024889 RepID=A0A7X9FRY3_9DELT|nr:hypothetical protein [SAR324 cluster bacterium]